MFISEAEPRSVSDVRERPSEDGALLVVAGLCFVFMNRSLPIELAVLSHQIETHRGEVVLRDIDSGYEIQFWLIPMSANELEEWWRCQDTFDCNPDGALDALCEFFGETPPPHSTRELPGIFLDADSDEAVNLWCAMSASRKHYFCSICCDWDSYLRRPDGTYIYHHGNQGPLRRLLGTSEC